jgi:hypothetical protein
MNEREAKWSSAAVVAGVIAAVLLLLLGYTAAYFTLGEAYPGMTSGEDVLIRHYAHYWEVGLFRPAAACEQRATGRIVVLLSGPSPYMTEERPLPLP